MACQCLHDAYMNTERILIIGATGFVGSRAMDYFAGASALPGEVSRAADSASVLKCVQKAQPELIIHTAAISDIGTCEADPDASHLANVRLTVALAQAAKSVGAKLICFSSDQVYTGCRDEGPYRDDVELPEPANVYARHKLEAEKRVLDMLPDAVMLRATWMYDMPRYGRANRGNLLTLALRAALRGEQLSFSRRDHRGITYVRQVAQLLEGAAKLPGGAYNYGSENGLNMYETVRTLFDSLGLSDRVDDVLKESDDAHHGLWMDCSRIRRHGIVFDNTAEGFERCAADYGLRFGG